MPIAGRRLRPHGPAEADFRGASEWTINPAENRLRGARFDAADLSGLVQSLGILLD